MAIEYNFTLDMDRSKRDNNIAYARTGDVDSVVINASLVSNGSPYTPIEQMRSSSASRQMVIVSELLLLSLAQRCLLRSRLLRSRLPA